MIKFELPFVSRTSFDRLWRENVELRNALKRANEDRRQLRLVVEHFRSSGAATARASKTAQ